MENQFHFLYPKINPLHGFIFKLKINPFQMDLFLTFFGGKPVPLQVDKFTCFVPCPFSAPSRAVVVAPLLSLARWRLPLPAAVVIAPALVPGPPASALACRRHHRAGSRPLPVRVCPRLPSSSSSPPPPTAADAPDRPSPSRRRASFHCFVCVVISRN